MGSSQWSYKSPDTGFVSIGTLLVTPLITTHEPPSSSSAECCQQRHLGFRILYGATKLTDNKDSTSAERKDVHCSVRRDLSALVFCRCAGHV